MVGLQVELLGELAIDGFDELAHGVMQPRQRRGQLLLIKSGQGEQANAVVLMQVVRFGGADVALVRNDSKVSMLGQ